MKQLKIILSCMLLSLPALATEKQKFDLKELSIFNATVPDKEFTAQVADKRSHMLDHHEKMGHITMGLMAATVATAIIGAHKIKDERSKRGGLKSKDDASKLNLHMGLAVASLASYFTTAYFSLSAPKPEGMEDETSRLWHKRLAWIHGASMILAPVLGYFAFKDYHDGKDPSGISKLHKPLMFVGVAAFAASYSIAVYEW
jgi:hypothetical protein